MKIKLFITLIAVFVLISLAVAQVLTTTDSTITVDKKYTSIVAGNYTAGVRICNDKTCSETIKGKYLDTTFTTIRTKCTDRNITSGECYARVNKTDAEITAERDAWMNKTLSEYAQGILDDQAKSIPATTTNGGKIVVK